MGIMKCKLIKAFIYPEEEGSKVLRNVGDNEYTKQRQIPGDNNFYSYIHT
jgi:hypothetical protein